MSGNSALKGLAYLLYIFAIFIMIFTTFYGFILYMPLICIASLLYQAGNKDENRSSTTYPRTTYGGSRRRRCPSCNRNYLTRNNYCHRCKDYFYDEDFNIQDTILDSRVPNRTDFIDSTEETIEKKCPNCGLEYQSDDAFCVNCGRFLNA